jgi:hypothetical protein
MVFFLHGMTLKQSGELCDTVRFQCYKGTGASLFSRCTLMCKVYVCNKDATARVTEDATGASAEWQKWYARHWGHWWRWRVLVRLARLCSSLSRLRRRDAQSDPGARLGLSIACTALGCPPPSGPIPLLQRL